MRVVDRLRGLYPDAPRHRLKQWLERGRVEVNGQITRDGRRAVEPGDRVSLGARGGARSGLRDAPPFPAALRLHHEDEDLLVIDKPAGLLTIATERERERTAYRLLWDYLAAQRSEEHTSELQSLRHLVCRLLLEKKKKKADQRRPASALVRADRVT